MNMLPSSFDKMNSKFPAKFLLFVISFETSRLLGKRPRYLRSSERLQSPGPTSIKTVSEVINFSSNLNGRPMPYVGLPDLLSECSEDDAALAQIARRSRKRRAELLCSLGAIWPRDPSLFHSVPSAERSFCSLRLPSSNSSLLELSPNGSAPGY